MPRQPVIFGFPAGSSLYAVDFHPDGRVVKQADGTLVSFDGDDYGDYDFALSDPNNVGVFVGTGAAVDFVPITAIFQRSIVNDVLQPPTYGDKRVGLASTEGVNVASILGSRAAAENLKQLEETVIPFEVVAGSNTTTRIQADIVNALDGAYVGRSIVFVSGDLKGCGCRVLAWDADAQEFQVSALPQAPEVGDLGVVL